MQQQRLLTVSLIGADVAALLLLRPPTRLAVELGHPRAWVARVGLDTVLASLAATAVWLVATWAGLGLLAVAARGAPGLVGRIAGRLSEFVLPGVLRRVIAGSAGVGVLLAPLPATATPLSGHRGIAAASAASGDYLRLGAPLWPSTQPSTQPSREPSWEPSTAPGAPSSATPAPGLAARRVPAPRWPSGSAGAPATPVQRPPGGTGVRRAHSTTPPRPRHVPVAHHGSTTVRPGDCLWMIAARRLGSDATAAAIAGNWPRWYASNRSVIGDDPNVIRPGVVLLAPTAPRSEARS